MSTQTSKIFPPGAPLRGVLKFLPLACGLVLAASTNAAVIDLAKPVSESLDTITGIYWKVDSIYDTNRTADASGNNYNGYLEAGVNSPAPSVLTPGVNLPGTTGYGSAIRLTTNVASPAESDRNSRIYYNTPSVGSRLNLQATDFTAGAWLNFSSLQTGTQLVMVMDRGARNLNPNGSGGPHGGGWSFFLEKNASGNWRIGFTARDNTASTTVYNGAYSDLGIDLGEWIHIGITFDYNAESDNTVNFFINGASAGTASIARDITAGLTLNGLRFSVGERAQSTYTSTFDGAMDDIFVTEGLHSFQAVPEPGSVALVLAAGVGVLALRKGVKTRNR